MRGRVLQGVLEVDRRGEMRIKLSPTCLEMEKGAEAMQCTAGTFQMTSHRECQGVTKRGHPALDAAACPCVFECIFYLCVSLLSVASSPPPCCLLSWKPTYMTRGMCACYLSLPHLATHSIETGHRFGIT